MCTKRKSAYLTLTKQVFFNLYSDICIDSSRSECSPNSVDNVRFRNQSCLFFTPRLQRTTASSTGSYLQKIPCMKCPCFLLHVPCFSYVYASALHPLSHEKPIPLLISRSGPPHRVALNALRSASTVRFKAARCPLPDRGVRRWSCWVQRVMPLGIGKNHGRLDRFKGNWDCKPPI